MSDRLDWTIKFLGLWTATHRETGETAVARSKEDLMRQINEWDRDVYCVVPDSDKLFGVVRTRQGRSWCVQHFTSQTEAEEFAKKLNERRAA